MKTRSGMAKKRLMCNAGVIDAGYRGEIIVLMENLGDEPYAIRKGDKIAQLLEHPFLASEVVEDELSEAARGAKGFGSAEVEFLEARCNGTNYGGEGGFEPPIPVKVCPLSRQIVSTTRAPLRADALAEIASRFSLTNVLDASFHEMAGTTRLTCALALLAKKRLHQVHAAGRQHTAGDFDLVIEFGMVEHLQHGMDRARFGSSAP